MNQRTVLTATAPVHGSVAVPGSKSIANRAMAIAALAHGDSVLHGVPDGDDSVAMSKALGVLGIETYGGGGGGRAENVTVCGRGGTVTPRGPRVFAGLAGTTSRFATALAALANEPVVIDGETPLRTRPMSPLHDALAALGVRVDHEERPGALPVRITGPLRVGGTIAMPGDVSSQFLTAVMMIAPCLAGGLEIDVTSPLISRPYVELTATVMAAFGVGGVTVGEDLIVVPEGRYRATDYTVEPDASSASYPWAIAAAVGGEVTVAGLTMSSHQGDIAIVSLLARMGCDAVHTDHSITIRRHPDGPLLGIDTDLADVSDLVPTIAAVAALASTPTTIRGVGFIRGKESDRLVDLTAELNRCGAHVAVTADGLHIEPAELHGATLSTHHDHRLAMAFGVLGSAVEGVVVDGADVVSKSWPGFWASYDALVRDVDDSSE